MHIGYVVDADGAYYVQLPDETQFGFSLYSEDQRFPGGVGIGTWRAVARDEVPQEARERLDHLLTEEEPMDTIDMVERVQDLAGRAGRPPRAVAKVGVYQDVWGSLFIFLPAPSPYSGGEFMVYRGQDGVLQGPHTEHDAPRRLLRVDADVPEQFRPKVEELLRQAIDYWSGASELPPGSI